VILGAPPSSAVRQNRPFVNEPLVKSLIRPILQRALPTLGRMPWLARLARPVFLRFPSLKTRLRRAAAAPLAAAPDAVALSDAQLRVLLDLREATEDSRTRP
jgi:hypothetical protein